MNEFLAKHGGLTNCVFSCNEMVGCCLLLTQWTDKHRLIPSNNHAAFIFWCFGPSSGRGLIIIEISQSHSDTPHSVALPWTSDQSVVGTSTSHHTTLTRLNIGPVLWHDERRTHKPIQIAFQQPILHSWRFRKPYYWICKYYFTLCMFENEKSHSLADILKIPSSHNGNTHLWKCGRGGKKKIVIKYSVNRQFVQ